MNSLLNDPTWRQYDPSDYDQEVTDINAVLTLQKSAFAEDEVFNNWYKNSEINQTDDLTGFLAAISENHSELKEANDLSLAMSRYDRLKNLLSGNNYENLSDQHRKNIALKKVTDKNIGTIEKYASKITEFDQSKAAIDNNISNFVNSHSRIQRFEDNRNERINNRVEGFISKLNDYKRLD